MSDCIFCKIINKEIPADFIYEDDSYIVLNDLYPKAPTHMLIIPKRHIRSVNDITESDSKYIGDMFLLAKKIAKQKDLSGYQLKFNVEKAGGQEIFHIHLHLTSQSKCNS